MSISIFSFYVNKKKDSKMTKVLDYYTIACIVFLDVSLIVTFYLSDTFITKAIYAPNNNISADEVSQLRKKPVITLLMTIIGVIILITILYWCSRKTFQNFKAAIDEYETFLLNFKETPRSKYAKKYNPPMEALPEESTIIDNTISVIYPHQKNSRGFSNMTKSVISGNYESKLVENMLVEDILTSENLSDSDFNRFS